VASSVARPAPDIRRPTLTIASKGSGLTLRPGPGRLSTSHTSNGSPAGRPDTVTETVPSIRSIFASPLARVYAAESDFQ
jgi:hypothetical protein